ncbi:hypothetical protein U9M48_004900 [Paspalum notatum var. saurae]|uniref:Uncharacterized protein n=1 Tax=Paspalum notatum var. saurae TaxID=547442 RepID=A0AAQ3SI09_PASNO
MALVIPRPSPVPRTLSFSAHDPSSFLPKSSFTRPPLASPSRRRPPAPAWPPSSPVPLASPLNPGHTAPPVRPRPAVALIGHGTASPPGRRAPRLRRSAPPPPVLRQRQAGKVCVDMLVWQDNALLRNVLLLKVTSSAHPDA